MQITIDASAILAVLLDEPARAELLGLTTGAELLTPGSTPWEVGNAMIALLRRGRIALPDAEAALEAFAAIPLRLRTVPLSDSIRIAARRGIYAYDAYVIQCAQQHGTALLSLDRQQCAAAAEEGVNVLEIST